VLTHGANPGLVSHLIKQALLNIARDTALQTSAPASRADWAELAQRLGVKVIHIAERDTQVSTIPKEPNEFVNTWSVDGFVSEGSQPAELGWGSHERNFPRDGRRHDFGCGSAIYLAQPGVATRVRSWTPLNGPYHGFLITHGEAISIADYYTVRKDKQVSIGRRCTTPITRATPRCCRCTSSAAATTRCRRSKRILMDDISKGIDELGVLLAGPQEERLLVRLAAVDR
jgi:homospermidine synthase